MCNGNGNGNTTSTTTTKSAVAADSNSNNNNDDEEEPLCIHESFHAQVAQTPHAVCLIEDDNNANNDDSSSSSSSNELTYAQVQRRILLLAAELRRAGAGRNKVVAIFMEPSADFVMACLAILSAGAAYVPLEMAYPTSMLQRVLQDAQPVAVITHHKHRALLPIISHTASTDTAAAVVCLDDAQHEQQQDHLDEHNGELLQMYKSWPAATLDDLAFVVYSSGTTGQPKVRKIERLTPALCVCVLLLLLNQVSICCGLKERLIHFLTHSLTYFSLHDKLSIAGHCQPAPRPGSFLSLAF